MTPPETFQHWVDLDENDLRSMLLALIGPEFGDEPEKHIPEIRESRKHFANYVADQSGITERDAVLDLGSGCGFATYWYAQRAKHVHACDISPAYLSFAKRECLSQKNVSFHLIQPRHLECIPDASIDKICATAVFIHFNLYDMYWYFREFARIVAPGGKIWIDIADFESLDLKTPNTHGGYFLKHAKDYHHSPSSLPGLLQWNSRDSVIRLVHHFGFDCLRSVPGGELLFGKR